MRPGIVAASLGFVLIALNRVTVSQERAAGNVSVQVRQNGSDHQLVVAGDAAANHVVIFDLKNTRFVAGVNGTTVNHQAIAHFRKQNLVDTKIDMGADDDQVMVATAIVGESEFEAEGGPGNDLFRARELISVAAGVKLTGFETIIPPESVAAGPVLDVTTDRPWRSREKPRRPRDDQPRLSDDRRRENRPSDRRP